MERLSILYRSKFGCGPAAVTPLTGSASNRRYFRMSSHAGNCIGVIGLDVKENDAFLMLASHFRSNGVNVPEVYAVSADRVCYIQEDLGDDILFDLYRKAVQTGGGIEDAEELLCRTMALLPKMQYEGVGDVDFSICYPQPSFDRRMVMFDLNYFKYCFLKPSGLEFNEILLQDELETFASDLLSCYDDSPTFLHRDFQSRNVMISQGIPYVIDFRGGRKGPAYYDVASFIWHARSGYPEDLKKKMLDSYLDSLASYREVDREVFGSRLMIFVLFRYLQVLGAYGFRGWSEHKANSVTAISDTVADLRSLLVGNIHTFSTSYPYFTDLLMKVTGLPRFAKHMLEDGKLTVTVTSFSFRKGVPEDPSGNGGGYVFDCRSIHNPGRYPQYRSLTGMDEPVIRFLEEDGEVSEFLKHVYGVIDPHVETFSSRGFTSLMVSFGCTGGQHRSVYCAEHLAAHLREKYPDIHVTLRHREQE